MKYAGQKRTNVVRFYGCEDSKVIKFIETEGRIVITRGWRQGRRRECFYVRIKFQICKMKKFWRAVSLIM